MAREYNYLEFSDVRALLPGLPTPVPASYRPNGTQIAAFMAWASNELDTYLGGVDYTVPIPTGATVALELLRGYAAFGAAWKTAAAMPQGRDSKHADMYRDEWKAILGRIEKGKVELPGVGKDSTRSLPAFPSGDPDAVGASPYFTRAGVVDR